jgi:hypothetical protein
MPDQDETKQANPKSRTHDLLMTIIGVFAVVLLFNLNGAVDTKGVTYPFYKGPTIFPIFVLSTMFIFSLPAMRRLLLPPPDNSWYLDGKGIPYRPMMIFPLLAGFFLVGFIYIGLELSVFLFLFISLYMLKHRSLFKLLVIPAIYTIIIVYLFKYVLNIYFPTPLMFNF